MGQSPLVSAVRYFGLVFGAGFLLGTIRVPILVPRMGERFAELVEMPVMLAAIYFASRRVSRRAVHRSPRAWLGVGVIALVLLVAAELGLAAVLQGRTLTEYVASRDPVSGTVYLAMLGVYAAMPWLQARYAARR